MLSRIKQVTILTKSFFATWTKIYLKRFGEAESILTSGCQTGSSSQTSSNATTNLPSSSSTTSTTSSSTATLASTPSLASSNANLPQASSQTTASSSSSSSSKHKLYDEIVMEYGTEYASYVLQILATVYW